MINQYERGLPAQLYQSQQQLQPTQQVQEVKFYKTGIFSFRAAAGWKLQYASFLGLNFWLRRVIVASYVK